MTTPKEAKNLVAVRGSVKFDAYRLLDRAVEEGVRYGYMRAYKYTDTPSKEGIIADIHQAVMHELCEIMDFDND